MPDARFELIGAGDETAALRRSSAVTVRPPIEWERREAAFAQASAILVTSRSEPFGMVVLEAMQAGVPVLYPRTSGAADALKSGIRIDPEATAAVADALTELLTRPELWEDVVRAQLAEIAAYAERNHALPIEAAWASVAAGPDRSVRGATATRTENP
jgi:glycosyltransferase involved in cell wall biosynthesis